MLTALQHPHDCSSARKLVCSLNAVGCGFGCQVHHAVHCLAHAVALNRTLILKVGGSNRSWRSNAACCCTHARQPHPTAPAHLKVGLNSLAGVSAEGEAQRARLAVTATPTHPLSPLRSHAATLTHSPAPAWGGSP